MDEPEKRPLQLWHATLQPRRATLQPRRATLQPWHSKTAAVAFGLDPCIEIDQMHLWAPMGLECRELSADYYGAVTLEVGGTNIFATARLTSSAGRRRLMEANDGEGNVVMGGATLSQYECCTWEEDVAIGGRFDALSIAAEPGSSVDITFSPDSSTWHDVVVQATVELCSSGEIYSEEHETCTPCAVGFIKFDNSSAACTTCEGSPLDCHGGSNFTLQNGSWMALDSIALACSNASADSGQCVLERVYECPEPSACTSATDRGNIDGSPQVLREAMCAAGYSTSGWHLALIIIHSMRIEWRE
ncbi:hypothetical protein CYMTET_36125 [Cymbomonas tetramitiformis]|uniref:Uncharacterized protein n=1 Tax=Cymbomonas tetramitiformis TaxID=36881 RepID=A0AAE0CGJ3_9CHLO|nr:hypothetical protein CYMTET_36125 [Cymbomonas tetramitiformis]